MKQTQGQRIYGVARTLIRQEANELKAATERLKNRPAPIRKWAREYFADRQRLVAARVRTVGLSGSLAKRFATNHCDDAVSAIHYALKNSISLDEVARSWREHGPRHVTHLIKKVLATRRKAGA